jgi:hypothetical protein
MGTNEDNLIRAADRLAYHLIGIMQWTTTFLKNKNQNLN